ncbi:hypothetical protein [Zavarzinella formosa]|uniref:hypothetical protein n=1 Tax=Zavarzinella formosa TaxID=360055 RepID=UPI0003017F99|nr:hypothetical protein [Zavarzinella formosa]
MDRRGFFGSVGTTMLGSMMLAGCRSGPSGEVLTDDKKDLVGSTAAGAEIYKPLIDEALGKLVAKQSTITGVQPAGAGLPRKRICFAGLRNKSSEELGDFKDQIVDILDTKINGSGVFQQISSEYVKSGLVAAGLRFDQLFQPESQRKFLAVMESQGQPFDYFLFASVNSGTTPGAGGVTQKDYQLSLELINIKTGEMEKESASMRKAYRR